MIIGDPYQFSIFVEVIDKWNSENTWINGVLLFSIDGELFPKQIVTATLNSEILPLKEILMKIKVNKELYDMEKEEAFIEMHNVTYPVSDVDNDYRYHISPPTLSDYCCVAFAVSNGEKIRFMAAKLDYIMEESAYDLNNIDISEAFITNDELEEIILKLDKLSTRSALLSM